LFIDDERKWVDRAIEDTEVGEVELTDESELKEMVDNSMHGQKKWISKVLPATRASVMVLAAQKLLMRRTEFAVIIAKETRKTIDESLADVDEAIDFLNYYAREEVKLPRLLCRGPFVVIAPWNFPLAIPCGMAVGPLVAGNSVLLKSSSKSHYVVEKFVELMHESGVPKDGLFHIKGGGQLADKLLDDERIRGCVFTGSKEVGAGIIKKVGPRIGELDTLRFSAKVIAETGGKNAIIVTATADLSVPSTASSISAVAVTIIAFFPPVSAITFAENLNVSNSPIRGPTFLIIPAPTSFEPVNTQPRILSSSKSLSAS
jgi:RHH-type proline utilization regulon transcriptional repressor/proline dehydrogenase/delta 1-pyrroline-5-carboxylate dehydrogenase